MEVVGQRLYPTDGGVIACFSRSAEAFSGFTSVSGAVGQVEAFDSAPVRCVPSKKGEDARKACFTEDGSDFDLNDFPCLSMLDDLGINQPMGMRFIFAGLLPLLLVLGAG